MSIIIKAPATYVQGKGELAYLGSYARRYGSHAFIICTDSAWRRIGRDLEGSLKAENLHFKLGIFSGACTKSESERLAELFRGTPCDLVLAVGGGSSMDIAKITADQLGVPLVLLPTTASNDAPCTSVTVVYDERGVVQGVHQSRTGPALVLADTQIIANSPPRLFSAGMGDALATWFEARACHATRSKTTAGGLCSHTALQMARNCFEILLRHGITALADVTRREVSEAVESVVEATIFMSGVGFESGGLAAAHAVHDGLTCLQETHSRYHGEKVAFGTLVQLILEKAADDELTKIYTFLRGAKLPTTLAQLGIVYPGRELLAKVSRRVMDSRTIGNLPFPVDEESVLEAILEADRIGRRFL